MAEYKQKKLYYYTADIQGIPPMQANLEILLKNELTNSPNARDTLSEYAKNRYRLIGHRYIPTGQDSFVALRLMSYEAGNKAQAFDKALNSPNVQTQAVMPPNANSEFLDGIAYLFIHKNNIIVSFSPSFRETAIQDYLNWVLSQRHLGKEIILLNKGISKRIKDNITDIKEFEFYAIPDFVNKINSSTTAGLNDMIVKGATKSKASLSVDSLIDPRPITMFSGYRINQRMSSDQTVFDEFVNKILRNIDPNLDWRITTKDKVLTRDDIMLTHRTSVLAIDSIIDDTDMYRKMYEWYKCLRTQKYI